MSIILIDARHYGEQLRHARHLLHLSANDVAKILKISVKDLHQYEMGRQPMPIELIFVMMHRGLMLSMCRAYNVKKV